MESINLNLIPQGANPVVHAKQFDEGRGFRFNLFNGTAPIVLTGAETITCNVKKPDGNLVTVAVTNTSSNYVEVYTTLQMCACYGANLGEIRLEEDGNDIGTLNFTLSVEESPLNNGIESESSIHNLNTMVDEMVAEEVATQYDSANVIFDNEPTENHGVGYTVTSEGIKTAIDNAFDYDNTASGSLVHITDGADNIPVKSLVSQIVAVESGSGEKSPDNSYTISGFDSGIIPRCGKNLIKKQALMQPVHLASGTTIYAKLFNFSGQFNLYGLKRGLPDVSTNWTALLMMSSNLGSVTLTDDYEYIGISSGAYTDLGLGDVQVSVEPFDTYSAYNGNTYTFTFGQTVYGGYFDNKGNLVVTHNIVDMGSLNWSYSSQNGWFQVVKPSDAKPVNNMNLLCSCYVNNGTSTSLDLSIFQTANNFRVKDSNYTDADVFKTAVNGQKIVYELATPITLAITSQDIPTLLGENNIFSNCGDVEVNYYTSKSNDILEFIDSEIGKKNGTNIPIEANSQDSIKDYVDNGLSGKADTGDLATKQNANVLNIVKHYDSGTSSDAITDIITEYGKVNMVFAFDVPLGYFTGCLTFANDNMGSGFIVLSTTGRFWVVSYVSGTITLTELT